MATVFSLKVVWPGNYYEARGAIGCRLKREWRDKWQLDLPGRQATSAQLIELDGQIRRAYQAMMIEQAEQSEQAQWCRDTNTPYVIKAGASFQYQPTALLELHISDPQRALMYKLAWHDQ